MDTMWYLVMCWKVDTSDNNQSLGIDLTTIGTSNTGQKNNDEKIVREVLRLCVDFEEPQVYSDISILHVWYGCNNNAAQSLQMTQVLPL